MRPFERLLLVLFGLGLAYLALVGLPHPASSPLVEPVVLPSGAPAQPTATAPPAQGAPKTAHSSAQHKPARAQPAAKPSPRRASVTPSAKPKSQPKPRSQPAAKPAPTKAPPAPAKHAQGQLKAPPAAVAAKPAAKATPSAKTATQTAPAACPPTRVTAAAAQAPLARLVGSGSEDLVGVEPQHGAYEMWRVAMFSCAVDHPVDLVQYAQSFDQPFYQYLADRVFKAGAVPLLTWEPWSYKAGIQGDSGALVAQPAYSLRTISDGSHDQYLRSFARAVRRFGRPLLIRFAPEMNGSWNAWSEGVNGNRWGDYVRAWRHVHDLFAEEGARNVLWVWSPDADCGACTSLGHFYPGSQYVDVLALDGYNWGRLHPWNAWRSFDEIFAQPLAELARLAPKKPELIAETASTESGGTKSAWISEFLSALPRYPRLAGFVWFNYVKETDWRVQSSASSRAAFSSGLRRAPESTAARVLRDRLREIEARYQRALEMGQLFP